MMHFIKLKKNDIISFSSILLLILTAIAWYIYNYYTINKINDLNNKLIEETKRVKEITNSLHSEQNKITDLKQSYKLAIDSNELLLNSLNIKISELKKITKERDEFKNSNLRNDATIKLYEELLVKKNDEITKLIVQFAEKSNEIENYIDPYIREVSRLKQIVNMYNIKADISGIRKINSNEIELNYSLRGWNEMGNMINGYYEFRMRVIQIINNSIDTICPSFTIAQNRCYLVNQGSFSDGRNITVNFYRNPSLSTSNSQLFDVPISSDNPLVKKFIFSISFYKPGIGEIEIGSAVKYVGGRYSNSSLGLD